MTDWPVRLTMLGCGNMGGAMLARWLECGLPRERVQVVNRSGTPPQPGIATRTSLVSDAPGVLVLALKPQQLNEAAALIGALPTPPDVIVSILAGVDLPTLQRRLPAKAIVRAMPNLPVAIGQGITLLHGDPAARRVATALAEPLGLAEWIDDEAQFDAATALSGSGPGFLFRYIDALAQGAVANGLSSVQAARLALATVAGSAAQAAAADVAPGELARRVASKGGSTQAGYDVLDANDALVALLTDMLRAATARNAELGRAAATA